jgi:hypothetical protein
MLLSACAADQDQVRTISLGSAPSTGPRITVPKAGPEGITPPSSWPKACDLLTKADMRAILPDITYLTQESEQLRFTVRTLEGTRRGVRRIPGGHCTYIYYLAGTQTEEFKESYKGWLNVTVELAGDPEVVETNYEAMVHGDETDALGAERCVLQSVGEYLCRTQDLVFTVHAIHVPYGFRFEDQPEDAEDMTTYFSEHAMPEFVKAVTSKLDGAG